MKAWNFSMYTFRSINVCLCPKPFAKMMTQYENHDDEIVFMELKYSNERKRRWRCKGKTMKPKQTYTAAIARGSGVYVCLSLFAHRLNSRNGIDVKQAVQWRQHNFNLLSVPYLVCTHYRGVRENKNETHFHSGSVVDWRATNQVDTDGFNASTTQNCVNRQSGNTLNLLCRLIVPS